MSKLDLHGVHHDDVFSKVSRFLNDHWNNPEGTVLEIITGHSEKMKSIVKDVVESFCGTYNLWNHAGIGEVQALQGVIKVEVSSWGNPEPVNKIDKPITTLASAIRLAKDRSLDEMRCIIDDVKGRYEDLSADQLRRISQIAHILVESDDFPETFDRLFIAGFISGDDIPNKK